MNQFIPDCINNNHLFFLANSYRLPVANSIGFSDVLKDDDIDNDLKADFINFYKRFRKKTDEVVGYLNHVRREINEKKEPVSFSGIAEDIKESIKSIIEKEKGQFITDFSAIDHINTLKSYIYSVFYNLISNGFKYRQKDVPLIIYK